MLYQVCLSLSHRRLPTGANEKTLYSHDIRMLPVSAHIGYNSEKNCNQARPQRPRRIPICTGQNFFNMA